MTRRQLLDSWLATVRRMIVTRSFIEPTPAAYAGWLLSAHDDARAALEECPAGDWYATVRGYLQKVLEEEAA